MGTSNPARIRCGRGADTHCTKDAKDACAVGANGTMTDRNQTPEDKCEAASGGQDSVTHGTRYPSMTNHEP